MVAPFFRQAWTVFAVLSNMIGQGMLLSFTSSLLPGLAEPESAIKADLHTASWLASSCGVAGIPGFLISSFLMDVYGRKLTHQLVILPGLVGWLAICFAQNIPTIIIGRVLGGITAGATVSLGAIVIGEFSNPKYRGVFLNLKTAAVCFGGMVVHIFTRFFTWRTIAALAVVPHVVAILITCTWPESPAWLASKGEFEKSEKAFFWLRENNQVSHKELQELIRAQKERLSIPKVEKSLNGKVRDFFAKFTQKDFLKPVSIILVSTALLETSGRHIFPAYALQIIGEVTGNKTQSFYYTLAIDLIITTSAVCSSILVKMMKRRTLLFSTGFAAFVAIMAVCTYLALGASDVIPNDKPWIAIGLFVVYFILVNLGCTPIPLALLGEVFPLAHRGVGSSIVGIFISLGVMIGLQVTPYMLLYLKVYGTFFIYGSALGVSLLTLFFILPETKDKTLQEIENYFNYGVYEIEEKDDDVKVTEKMIK
ncbi:unnamed protein product [Arctia plantaginis]|uniref:Major facilitator superfamily (MFS) profile domain-containing protein n=1 Tax=Arctia plantaginis TaxID=874455 RepID=A0A8S1BBL7_ARCPL|nr:unnamed protein product [Arctia plantaginis]